MNKEKIRKKIILRLGKRLVELQKSIKKNEQFVIDSPHPGQSWSDTTRSQLRRLNVNLETRCFQIKDCVKKLEKLEFSKTSQKIQMGSLVETKEQETKEKFFYFIVPKAGGGETIKVNGNKIYTLAIDSPLAQKLLGKKVENEIII